MNSRLLSLLPVAGGWGRLPLTAEGWGLLQLSLLSHYIVSLTALAMPALLVFTQRVYIGVKVVLAKWLQSLEPPGQQEGTI